MNKRNRIYLDNAATTPIDPVVLKAMLSYFKNNYGNASSLHQEGRIARNVIKKARKSIAEFLNVNSGEIFFTSGGTESDNLAIIGIARANKEKGKHIIVSSIEHKAVLESCKKLEKEGFEITYLKVDNKGIVSIEQLKKSLRPDTILVSVMYANNEIGTIQPIRQISKFLRESKISNPIFHTDACQAVGSLTVNAIELGVDAMTISSSKIYGPKGVGCLYLNEKIKIDPIIVGGEQEMGMRAGTENVASIVGFSAALKISEKIKNKETKRELKLRDYFISQISKKIKGVLLNGSSENRLPNNINVSIKGVEGESLVLFLDEKGISCSTGSACTTNDLKPSHVLINIGVPIELAHCSIRFTLGRYTQKNDVDYTIKALSESVEKIRMMSPIK